MFWRKKTHQEQLREQPPAQTLLPQTAVVKTRYEVIGINDWSHADDELNYLKQQLFELFRGKLYPRKKILRISKLMEIDLFQAFKWEQHAVIINRAER